MLAALKTLRWLLLAVLPCLALRCQPGCDLCSEPLCEGQYQGGLSLRPASLTWLPAPAPDSLRFVNSNGFRAVLDRVRMPAAPDSVLLPAFISTQPAYSEAQLNPVARFCGAYFRARRVAWHYQGRNLNLDLQFNLLKYPGTDPAASAVPLTRAGADTLPDVVVVAFNQQYYAEFPVGRAPYRQPRPTSLGTAVYLDSVQLAGRKFFGVYQFSRQHFTPGVQPQRFYFRPGQGLVGFIYSNNEQWALL